MNADSATMLASPSEETLTDFPQELRDLPQWVARNSKKEPIDPHTGRWASTTNPATWGTFEEAVAKAEQDGLPGVGLVLRKEDMYCGVDFDHCRDPETGDLDPSVSEWVRRLDSYTEVSPSGTGVHVLMRGMLPHSGKKGDREMYDHGRYFTVTGQRLESTPKSLRTNQPALRALHDETFGGDESPKDLAVPEPVSPPLRDDEVLSKIRASTQAEQFERLWEGDTSAYAQDSNEGRSEADLALVSKLSFYSQYPHQLDKLFRRSGLYREKWERADYRDRTIRTALTGREEFWGAGKDGEHPYLYPHLNKGTHKESSWPEMREEAFYGLPGDIVRAYDPVTEADPAAVLISLLTAAGSIVGTKSWLTIGLQRHYLKLFVCLVGETSKGRKGTSWSIVEGLFNQMPTGSPWKVDLEKDETYTQWLAHSIHHGMSTGEGLIHVVRDKVEKEKEGGTEVVDEGAKDKRALIIEPEFARVLKVMAREQNILSTVVRTAWDSAKLSVMTRNNPLKATGAHVSLIGHVTKTELLRFLTETDQANGFGNRLLFPMVKRSKLLPEATFGELKPPTDTEDKMVKALQEAVDKARHAGELGWSEDAKDLWGGVYEKLSEPEPGLFGAIVSRAEAQVPRIAALYALLDGSKTIEQVHLRAALAVWDYCEESARYIFGDATGDPVADQILENLRLAGEDGMSRTDIHRGLGKHKSTEETNRALGTLAKAGRAVSRTLKGKGRPEQRWYKT